MLLEMDDFSASTNTASSGSNFVSEGSKIERSGPADKQQLEMLSEGLRREIKMRHLLQQDPDMQVNNLSEFIHDSARLRRNSGMAILRQLEMMSAGAGLSHDLLSPTNRHRDGNAVLLDEDVQFLSKKRRLSLNTEPLNESQMAADAAYEYGDVLHRAAKMARGNSLKASIIRRMSDVGLAGGRRSSIGSLNFGSELDSLEWGAPYAEGTRSELALQQLAELAAAGGSDIPLSRRSSLAAGSDASFLQRESISGHFTRRDSLLSALARRDSILSAAAKLTPGSDCEHDAVPEGPESFLSVERAMDHSHLGMKIMAGLRSSLVGHDTSEATSEASPSKRGSESSFVSPTESVPESEESPSEDKASVFGLVMAMEETNKSQAMLQDWDKRMGLKKSHSKTMRSSRKSRKQLLEAVGVEYLLGRR